MTPRDLWDIQLEISRRQFGEEPGLEKVLESFILPTALDIQFRKCQELETSSGAFFKAQISTLHFPMISSQSHCHIQLPSAGLCSKVSVAEAAPLEMDTLPSGLGLWPLDYMLVGVA